MKQTKALLLTNLVLILYFIVVFFLSGCGKAEHNENPSATPVPVTTIRLSRSTCLSLPTYENALVLTSQFPLVISDKKAYEMVEDGSIPLLADGVFDYDGVCRLTIENSEITLAEIIPCSGWFCKGAL